MSAIYPIETVFAELFSESFSMLARLAKLADCWDRATAHYRNDCLERELGYDGANAACAVTHKLVWKDWIRASLEQQKADLLAYLRENPSNAEVLARVSAIVDWAPRNTPAEECRLARSNFTILAALLGPILNTQHLLVPQPALNCPSETQAVRDVLKLIHTLHTDPNISPPVVSQVLGLSNRQIARIVRAHTGMTFTAYVRHLRVATAKHLLTTSTTNVKTIATMVGYSDVTWFTKYFRHATGSTPAKFRKQQQACFGLVFPSSMADFA